jgi:parallel beta-helix repeat protein
MRRMMLLFAVMAAALLVASGGALAVTQTATTGSRTPVVHPGQSIQAAVDRAEPGTTIVVKPGVYRERVVIHKNGTSLVGEDAVMKPPAGGKPTCAQAGFCVVGDVNFQTGKVSGYVHNVSVTGFTIKNFKDFGIVALAAHNSRFVKNRAFGNGEYGITAFASRGTQFISNVTSGSGEAGIYVGDSPHADASVIKNDTHNDHLGILVRDARHGNIVGNEVHDNCMGIMFLADQPGPAGGFDVSGNTVQNNDHSCPSGEGLRPISGVGIGLIGAKGVEIHGNRILGNVPSGPTAYRGGVAVVRGPGGTPPTNNSVIGNTILHNRPDLFWDKSGSGNRYQANDCNTSKPGGLCRR